MVDDPYGCTQFLTEPETSLESSLFLSKPVKLGVLSFLGWFPTPHPIPLSKLGGSPGILLKVTVEPVRNKPPNLP